jgi:hypothetical protein
MTISDNASLGAALSNQVWWDAGLVLLEGEKDCDGRTARQRSIALNVEIIAFI